jgi:RNA polymerase sigma-70 factor (ECF subfamily)
MSKRDVRRFTALIEPQLEALFRAAYRLSRNRADADDLVQETCVRAFLRIGDFREGHPVKPWLLRVMHNLFVDGTRRARLGAVERGVGREHPADSTESPEPNPEAVAYTTQREELLQRAWVKLDRGHRALLALKAEGYTLAEIGEITGLATEALTARLYRARQSFARHLAAEQGFAPALEMEVAK